MLGFQIPPIHNTPLLAAIQSAVEVPLVCGLPRRQLRFDLSPW
jgi:hypothetical protein